MNSLYSWYKTDFAMRIKTITLHNIHLLSILFLPNQVKSQPFYREISATGSSFLRDDFQQMTTDAQIQTPKPLAFSMINAVGEGLNLGENEHNHVETNTNDENVYKMANMYDIDTAVEKYFGSIWWARD